MKSMSEICLSNVERRCFFAASRGRLIPRDTAHRLESLGLVTDIVYSSMRARCVLTSTGRRYRDYLLRRRNDVRWERGLAIAAIVISIAALCVAVLSLWLQWKSL